MIKLEDSAKAISNGYIASIIHYKYDFVRLYRDGRFWNTASFEAIKRCPNYSWIDYYNPLVDRVVNEAAELWYTAFAKGTTLYEIYSRNQYYREYWWYDIEKNKVICKRNGRNVKKQFVVRTKEFTVRSFFFYCIRRAAEHARLEDRPLKEDRFPHSNSLQYEDRFQEPALERKLTRKIRKKFSTTHAKIFIRKLRGLNNQQIAEQFGQTPQNIRRKIRQLRGFLSEELL